MARSQGSVALRRRVGRELSQEAVASAVGVSRVTVSNWMNGTKRPAPAKRDRIRELYGIEPSSWDAAPAKVPKADAPPPLRAPGETREVTPDSVLEQAADLERRARVLLEDLDNDAEATPLERAKVMNSVTQTLALIAKITGQFDLGQRFFRLPVWREIERALERGLHGHPDAASAVGRELRLVEQASGYKRP